MVVLLEAVGREVFSPVSELHIRHALVNVRCKENAAAMRLCNKKIKDEAYGAAASKRGRKCRRSRQIGEALRFREIPAMSRMKNRDIVRRNRADKRKRPPVGSRRAFE
jgi:hypothetical protein